MVDKCVFMLIGKLKDGSIATYQTLPWNHRGWHAGGDANNTHIGFEICEDNLTDKTYFNKVYKEAVELAAYLCKQYKLTEKISSVIMKAIRRKLRVIMVIHVIGFQSMVSQWIRSEQM